MTITPIYSKQYIRYAETLGATDALVPEYSIVSLGTDGKVAVTTAATAAQAVGVSQQMTNALGVVEMESRLVPVATSGLLAVRVKEGQEIAPGDPLRVATSDPGLATMEDVGAGVAAVEIGNTIPICREGSQGGVAIFHFI